MNLPPATEFVTYSVDSHIATITFNRPDRLNALLPDMIHTYSDLLTYADLDPDVRVIVETGAGRGFCAGADLSVLAEGPDALDDFVRAQSTDDLPTIAMELSCPVVMAVNGAAAGIGMVLALAGDVRFASPTARFISAFSRLGLTAEYGVAWLLQRQVGAARAYEILLSGRPVSAQEAAQIGLVHQIADDPFEAAMAWARDVADNCSPMSLAVIKAQLVAAGREDFATHLPTSLNHMSESFRWPDLTEALTAKITRRAVSFPDRPRGGD